MADLLNKKLKIIYFNDSFPPHSAGAGIVAYNLAKKMKELRHKIYIITTVQESDLPEKIEYQGLTIFQIYTNHHVRWRAYHSLYNKNTVKRVKQLISDIQPDIVHFHNVHWRLSYACFKLAKQFGAKTFLTVHDMMLVHYDKFREFVNYNDLSDKPKFNYKISVWHLLRFSKKRFNPFRNIIIRYYLKYIDQIFSVCDELKNALETNGVRNIITVHNGIDSIISTVNKDQKEKFKIKHGLAGNKIILYGGRLSGAKGAEVIVAALARLIHQAPQTKLLIAGKKGDVALKLIEFAKKLGVEDNLVFTGWLDREEIAVAFQASDIVVVPSIYLDPFPTVNLEAMAAGLPVVGTCFGGTKELVINDLTGFIVNPLNIDRFAEKLLTLLKNEDLAQEFGNNGLLRVTKFFTLEKQARKLEKFYFESLE
ncbi:MAG: hypothetical protein CMI53_03295 [Parcubacteria group bacterium]|nr:hypothetical protein [Parcubacteria group bacterium]|tara:strand:- start:4945 stop:6216 length:1272 start_codon:yes stop_codon:yes gene_type:complete